MPHKQFLRLTLEFSSGAELFFGGVETKKIELDGGKIWTLEKLLVWMASNILTVDASNFLQGNTVRPGILVLVNEVDWEVLGELNYVLQDGDHVLFISSMHGG